MSSKFSLSNTGPAWVTLAAPRASVVPRARLLHTFKNMLFSKRSDKDEIAGIAVHLANESEGLCVWVRWQPDRLKVSDVRQCFRPH